LIKFWKTVDRTKPPTVFIIFPGFIVTLYPVIAPPPLSGAIHEIVAELNPIPPVTEVIL
jgi:hypothetical protein